MSAVSLAFDWSAPVPQPFTRASGPTFWPGDRRYRPLDARFRRWRDLKALTQALPPHLSATLRERFKPARGELRWETPPALPSTALRGYASGELAERSARFVRSEITVTASLIERLLNAPEGMVGGLTHNSLFAMQMLRLGRRAASRLHAGAGLAAAVQRQWEGRAPTVSGPCAPSGLLACSNIPCILLPKVGGGYSFIYRLLLDYSAALETPTTGD